MQTARGGPFKNKLFLQAQHLAVDLRVRFFYFVFNYPFFMTTPPAPSLLSELEGCLTPDLPQWLEDIVPCFQLEDFRYTFQHSKGNSPIARAPFLNECRPLDAVLHTASICLVFFASVTFNLLQFMKGTVY